MIKSSTDQFMNIEFANTDPKIEKFEVVDSGEQYMSSCQWLKKYGLGAKKLDLFDVLGGVAFKHRDGVVNIKEAPGDMLKKEAVSSLSRYLA